jgi:hypothetical protein
MQWSVSLVIREVDVSIKVTKHLKRLSLRITSNCQKTASRTHLNQILASFKRRNVQRCPALIVGPVKHPFVFLVVEPDHPQRRADSIRIRRCAAQWAGHRRTGSVCENVQDGVPFRILIQRRG